jgi:hypothetical protein
MWLAALLASAAARVMDNEDERLIGWKGETHRCAAACVCCRTRG